MKCSPLLALFFCTSFVPDKSYASRIPVQPNLEYSFSFDSYGDFVINGNGQENIKESWEKYGGGNEVDYMPLEGINNLLKRSREYSTLDSDVGSRKIRRVGDMDAGDAFVLPHLWFEMEPEISPDNTYTPDLTFDFANPLNLFDLLYEEALNSSMQDPIFSASVQQSPLVIPDTLIIAPQLQNILHSVAEVKSNQIPLLQSFKDISQISVNLADGYSGKFDPLVSQGLFMIMGTYINALDKLSKMSLPPAITLEANGQVDNDIKVDEIIIDVSLFSFDFTTPKQYYDYFNQMVYSIQKSNVCTEAIKMLANFMALVEVFEVHLHPDHQKLAEYKYYYDLLQTEIDKLMNDLDYEADNISVINEKVFEGTSFTFSEIDLNIPCSYIDSSSCQSNNGDSL